MSKIKLFFPHFQHAALRGLQMGEVRRGPNMPRPIRSNAKTKHRAISLRKEATPAEVKLWSRIRNDQLDYTFRRQHAIGNYIVDFCAPRKKLIIELDGPPFGRNIWTNRNMTRSAQNISKRVAIGSCGSGTMTC